MKVKNELGQRDQLVLVSAAAQVIKRNTFFINTKSISLQYRGHNRDQDQFDRGTGPS